MAVGGVAAAVLAILIAAQGVSGPLVTAPTSPSTPSPGPVVRVPVTMDVGGDHACRVGADGKVACWGSNGSGQLGFGIVSWANTRPEAVVGIDAPVTSVSTGGTHTCALTSVGDVWCWGANDSGQLGDGTTESSGLPVRVVLGEPAVDVSAGGSHTCAVTRAGGVSCWGAGWMGQLGDGRALPRAEDDGTSDLPVVPARSTTPVGVVGLGTGVVSVSAGADHTCAVTAAGGVKCWGGAGYGQLGDGSALVPFSTGRGTSLPVDVVGQASGVAVVAAGSYYTCALTSAGGVLCWGANGAGQLGDGTHTAPQEESPFAEGPQGRSVPGPVVGLTSGVTSIAAGNHSCAVTSGGRALCWGTLDVGHEKPLTLPALGATPADGEWSFNVKPVEVAGLPVRVTSVSVGDADTCATAGSQVSCWGINSSGELGDGTTLDRAAPVTVADVNPSIAPARAVRINVIMVDSDLDVTKDVPIENQKAATALAQRLKAQDPAVLRTIREAFRAATSGIFDPTVKVVTASQRLTVPGACLDRFTDDESVQAAARPLQEENALNIVVMRALICSESEDRTWAGYDGSGAGQLPVVGWLALGRPDGMIHTMIHEYGHDAGLLHAGRSDCQDPVTNTGCTVDEVGDLGSVMSYQFATDAYDVPELHLMGLVGDRVVIDVSASTAEEVRIGTGRSSASALLINPDPHTPDEVPYPYTYKDRVYISGEPGQLVVRSYVLGSHESSHGADAAQASFTSVEWRLPQPGTTIYQGKDVTVTYRGAGADGTAVLHVARANPAATPATPSAEPTLG